MSSDCFTDGEVTEAKRAVYLLAAALTPQEIREIRQSREYAAYVRLLQMADQIEKHHLDRPPEESSAAVLERAFHAYRSDLTKLAPLAATGRLQRRRFFQKASTITKVAGTAAPAAVGLVAQELGPGSVDPKMLTAARFGTAAFFWLMGHFGPERAMKSDESRASRAQSLVRRNGSVKVELFGPVARRYWPH